ncbi:hypothetical protein Tco_0732903 [Tanacetum coccineum]
MSGRRSRREPAAGLNPSQEELMLTGSFCLSIFHALIETKSLPSSSLLPDPDLPFETIDFLLEEQGRSEEWGMGMGYGVWGNGVWGMWYGVWVWEWGMGMVYGYGMGYGYGGYGMGYEGMGNGYGYEGMGYGV